MLTGRDEMSNVYREHSIDASYQVSVHLAKRFQKRIFLEIDQSEKKYLHVAAMFFGESGRHEQYL